MIVTKEEAEKLWCPMVRNFRSAGFGSCAINRVYSFHRKLKLEEYTCIADGCMMWVYVDGKLKGHCGLCQGEY